MGSLNAARLIEILESRPLDEQGLLARDAVKQIGENDFFFFCKYILGYKDLDWAVHREPTLVLESLAHRKMVVFPRGTFKSTKVSVGYPIWRLAKNPNLTILLDSEVFTNSKNFLREIRSHLSSNKKLQWVWGPWMGPVDNESETIIQQRTQNRKEASITVGGIETVKVGQHYDIIIGDDYNSPTNSNTPEKCQKVIDHVRYNLNILNPRDFGPDGMPIGEYLFALTRYAERDIAGWALRDILNEKHLAEGVLKIQEHGILEEDRLDSELSFSL